MPESSQRKNLGRGLSALIPDADMAFLSQIARGEATQSTVQKSRGRSSRSPSLAKSQDKGSIKVDHPQAHDESVSVSPTKTNDEHLSNAFHTDPAVKSQINFIEIGLIEANPYQPRRTFSPKELDELSSSIREHGLLQPIIVRPLNDVSDASIDQSALKYQLVAGERRWRAAQAAGLEDIPAIVRPVSDQQALELALIENVQRHDISALDAAVAYRRLAQEFSLSQEQVAQRVGKSRSSIANTIRLLDLPPEAQKAIEEGALSEGHGRAILLASSDGARRAVLRRILRDKLSVRDAEELGRQSADDAPSAESDEERLSKSRLSPEAKRIEESLQKHLGTRVKLKMRRQGGQIMIHYFSNEELDRVLKLIVK